MLTAFTAGLLLITISELGDKTFFIAMLLAMRHPKRLVLSGVVAALAAMTVLSVLMGQAVAFLPAAYIHYAEIALFLGFGVKLLYEAKQMPATCKAANPSDPTCASEGEKEAVVAVAQAEASLKRKTPIAVVLEAFVLTFLAEWGDRTQIATIALAASNNPLGVTAGAIVGHSLCAVIAVMGGCLVAGRISERTIVALGGVLFLTFGAFAWWEGA